MPGGMGFPGLVRARGGCGAARRVLRVVVGGAGGAAWAWRVSVRAVAKKGSYVGGGWAGLVVVPWGEVSRFGPGEGWVLGGGFVWFRRGVGVGGYLVASHCRGLGGVEAVGPRILIGAEGRLPLRESKEREHPLLHHGQPVLNHHPAHPTRRASTVVNPPPSNQSLQLLVGDTGYHARRRHP